MTLPPISGARRSSPGPPPTSADENVPEVLLTLPSYTLGLRNSTFSFENNCILRPLGLFAHHVEAHGEVDGHHQALRQLPRNRCLAEADGPIWGPTLNR